MKMREKDIYAIIARCLTKAATDKDEENLESWINENDENRLLYEKLSDHWNSPEYRKVSILKSEEVKNDIWEKVNQKKFYYAGSKEKKRINGYLKYAAVLLLLISSIFVVYFQLNQKIPEQPAARLISKSNNAGRKSTIFLKDGTEVNLNSESKVSYHETFSDTARIIWLTGEAFFHVARDETKPFYVISQNLKVEALGTSFNVSGYPDTDIVKVSLSTGKVLVNMYAPMNVETSSNEIELLPGQEISFQKSTNIFSPVSSYNNIEVEGWKDGVLYFKHAGLEEIIKKLERWYGVEVQINGPAKEISYTGLFKNQNLKNVVASIGFATGIDFMLNKKK